MKETRMGKADGNKPGLYENIRKKRERIAAGSGEKMKKPGQKGAPSASDFKQAAKTAKPEEKKDMGMRAKYDRMKKGCDCTDGAKGKCSCGKKDGGMKKSPYADGCGYMKDSVAADFKAVLDSMGVEKISKGEKDPDDDRDDKKCGASGIADNKKCTKGVGQAKKNANSPDRNGGEAVNAKGGYARFLKQKGVDPSKLGANSKKAESLAQEYYNTKAGRAEMAQQKQYKKGNVDPNQKKAQRLRTAARVAGTVGALAPLAGIASGNTAGMVAGFGAARTAFSAAGALNTMSKAQATGSKAGRDRLNKEAKRQLASVGGTLAGSAVGALAMRNLNRSAKRRQGLERLYRGPSAKRDAA